MEDLPFIFGKLVTETDFTNREKEAARLATNFRNKLNTMILSPRRWGKTSLVNRVSEMLGQEEPDIKICHIDLFNVRTEEDFYITLATEILKTTSKKWEELAQNAKEFLSRLLPRISFPPEANSEISFEIGWEKLKKNPDQILDLAETIASERGLKLVVCMTNFRASGIIKIHPHFKKSYVHTGKGIPTFHIASMEVNVICCRRYFRILPHPSINLVI